MFLSYYLSLEEKAKRDIIGEVFNNDETDLGKKAVAYGTANTNNYHSETPKGYVSPETIPQIPDEVPRPKAGPLEPIDEIPTPHDYYDGGLKLNVVKVKCTIYTTQSDCIHASGCGWCGSTNSCILGNGFGPQQPCVKASFIASPPIPNWNPQTRVVNQNVGGVTSHVISTNS